MAEWAAKSPHVKGLVLIGSRQRSSSDRLQAADDQSDWDFQVITTNPAVFRTRAWTSELKGVRLLHYSLRSTRIGDVPKAHALFEGFEMDLVVIPAKSY